MPTMPNARCSCALDGLPVADLREPSPRAILLSAAGRVRSDAFEDSAADGAHLLQLGFGELIDDEFADLLDMARSGVDHLVVSVICEDRWCTDRPEGMAGGGSTLCSQGD